MEKRIVEGSFSESGMARILGISQCHMNNLIKRRKHLTTTVADKIILRLRLNVLELIERYQNNLEERRRKGEVQSNSLHLVENKKDIGEHSTLPRE